MNISPGAGSPCEPGLRMESHKGPAVIFICTANICRSPMAAALFHSRLKKERADWQSWRVDSAGTWALDGEMAAKNSRQVMAQRGLDISGHRAKTVSAELLEEYDLILTMEQGHKEALRIEFPAIAGRVFMLGEMAGTLNPIDDPFGQSLPAYEAAAKKIDQMLAQGMRRIVALTARQQEQ